MRNCKQSYRMRAARAHFIGRQSEIWRVLLRSLRDLSHLPFTTPEDLRQDPGQFVCVSQDEVARIITLPTSGTSGLPKRIYFSAEDQELTVDFFQIGMSTLARPGDRVLILLPGPKPGTVGQLLTVGLERLGCNPILVWTGR